MALANGQLEEFDILEVARRCNIEILNPKKPLPNGQYLARCPFCGDSTKSAKHGHLYLKPATGEYKCQRCGEGGFTVGFYARLRGIDTKEAYKELASATGETPDIRYDPKKMIQVVDEPLAPLERRHEVYNDFLEMLLLRPIHWSDLLKRGLPNEVITQDAYKSFPTDPKQRWSLCGRLSQKHDLSRVPGFYINRSGKWDIVPYPEGYLIAVRNINSQIQGLQFRIFPYDKEKHAHKFVWLSSTGRPEGSAARQWIHVVIPPELQGAALERIWITEGSIKANIASFYTGAPFLGIPGTSAVKDVIPVIQRLGVKEAVLAFDADQYVNPFVMEAVAKLENGIREAKIAATSATWPTTMVNGKPHPKGIDDACVERFRKSLEVSEEVFIKPPRIPPISMGG